MKREAFKELEVSGRKFRVGRFDALTGSYIVTLILMQMLPMGLDTQLGLGAFSQGRSLMDKNTFFDVQRDCLKICSEIQSVGNVSTPLPVMLEDGRWGVADIENDASIVLALTIHTLVFNVTDFFQGDALKEVMTSFQVMNQSNAKE